MKYYSELTGELFNTEEELIKAEEELHEKNAEKERAMNEIDAAYRKAVNAWKDYLAVSNKYKEYDTSFVPNTLFETVIKNFFD